MALKIDEKWLTWFKRGLDAGQINAKLDGEYEPNKVWHISTVNERGKIPERMFKEGYALGYEHAWLMPLSKGKGRLDWLEKNGYIRIVGRRRRKENSDD